MRNLLLRNTSVRLLLLVSSVGFPLTLALGHEGHPAECNDTAIDALKADIQAMGNGEARTTASKEVEAAQQMMAKNDINRISKGAGEYAKCAAGVTLHPAWNGLRSIGASTPARQNFGAKPTLLPPNSSGS